MVFSSHVFLFYFLPTALGLYFLTPPRGRQALLTALSYAFYGWANPWFVLLMLFSTLVDYHCGQAIVGQRRLGRWARRPPGSEATPAERKRAVTVSVVVNLALLGFFKYFVFVQQNLNWAMETFGRDGVLLFEIALPAGISFYTFQSMSYSIDLYRGHARPADNLLDFACYVALFPQLVAGPIVRYSDVAHQLSRRSHTLDKFARGAAFLIMGLGKKILLANPMAEAADMAFGAGDLLWFDAWTGAGAFAFQIYFDFSGYSDMAIGLGLMIGFNFPKNFDGPYRADSITNFWQRWHMSLSTWLRDYLYVPLGGNRHGGRRTYRNLALVMLLGGLWHGANWNFVIWGAIHGSMLGAERAIGKNPFYRGAPRVLRVLFTFAVVLITWVFFKAGMMDTGDNSSLGVALAYVADMFGAGGNSAAAHLVGSGLYDRYHLIVFGVCAFIVWGCRQSWDHARHVGALKAVALAALFVWSVAVMFTQTYNPFIYFIF